MRHKSSPEYKTYEEHMNCSAGRDSSAEGARAALIVERFDAIKFGGAKCFVAKLTESMPISDIFDSSAENAAAALIRQPTATDPHWYDWAAEFETKQTPEDTQKALEARGVSFTNESSGSAGSAERKRNQEYDLIDGMHAMAEWDTGALCKLLKVVHTISSMKYSSDPLLKSFFNATAGEESRFFASGTASWLHILAQPAVWRVVCWLMDQADMTLEDFDSFTTTAGQRLSFGTIMATASTALVFYGWVPPLMLKTIACTFGKQGMAALCMAYFTYALWIEASKHAKRTAVLDDLATVSTHPSIPPLLLFLGSILTRSVFEFRTSTGTRRRRAPEEGSFSRAVSKRRTQRTQPQPSATVVDTIARCCHQAPSRSTSLVLRTRSHSASARACLLRGRTGSQSTSTAR